MLVNALSYGTVIPLLYPYASRFGIDATGLSFLFASFSLFQFLATPIIGRLSDTYGRKPLLLASLFGTAVSQALFALAWSQPILFLARILDGVTGGNMSVAQAIITDTHSQKERTKAFGLLGASFGFGFLIGPALGGVLSQIYVTLPFWFSAALALFGTVLGIVFLPETLKLSKTEQPVPAKLFDLKKMVTALCSSSTGTLLFITLIASIGVNAFIIGFQSTMVDVFSFSPLTVGIIFTAFGLANIMMQSLGLRILLKFFSSKQLLFWSLVLGAAATTALGLATTSTVFLVIILLYMWIPPTFPFLSTLISQTTRHEDQGAIMGLSQSYTSIGQIVGPLLAGFAARFDISWAFFITMLCWIIASVLTKTLSLHTKQADL